MATLERKNERMMTQAEAAELLGVRPSTLAAWRALGTRDLPYCKVGRCVRYRHRDVLDFIESSRVHPRPGGRKG